MLEKGTAAVRCSAEVLANCVSLCLGSTPMCPSVLVQQHPSSSELQFICENLGVCDCQTGSDWHRGCSAGDEVLVGTLEKEELLQLNVQQLEYR